MQPQDLRHEAHEAVLIGLPASHTLTGIQLLVGQSHVPGVYTPDLAMLELVVAALDVAGVDPTHPLSTAGWPSHHLPEVKFRTKPVELERLLYALHAAAAFRTGLHPSVAEDTAAWKGDTLWPHATRAAVMTIRAVADGRDLAETCDQVRLAVRPLHR